MLIFGIQFQMKTSFSLESDTCSLFCVLGNVLNIHVQLFFNGLMQLSTIMAGLKCFMIVQILTNPIPQMHGKFSRPTLKRIETFYCPPQLHSHVLTHIWDRITQKTQNDFATFPLNHQNLCAPPPTFSKIFHCHPLISPSSPP